VYYTHTYTQTNTHRTTHTPGARDVETCQDQKAKKVACDLAPHRPHLVHYYQTLRYNKRVKKERQKRHRQINRDLEKRPTKETYKRDLCKSRNTFTRDSCQIKETFKRDMGKSNEKYKRDVQKRPNHMCIREHHT